ncbi:MAG: hypothetical protein AB4290_22980 [Spirulina sp.]
MDLISGALESKAIATLQGSPILPDKFRDRQIDRCSSNADFLRVLMCYAAANSTLLTEEGQTNSL